MEVVQDLIPAHARALGGGTGLLILNTLGAVRTTHNCASGLGQRQVEPPAHQALLEGRACRGHNPLKASVRQG